MSDSEIRLSIPRDIDDNLQALAHDLGKPVDYVIITALEKYIRDCEESGEYDAE